MSDKRIKRLKRELDISESDLMMPYLQLMNIIQEKINPPMQTQPLDMSLQLLASGLNLPVSGIESLEEQMKYYAYLINESDGNEIYKISKNFKSIKHSIKKLSAYYADNQIEKLHKLSKQQLGKHRQIMLNHRNKIMADRILQLDFEQSHFIAIGAAHLWGGKGVLRILKNGNLKINRHYNNFSSY